LSLNSLGGGPVWDDRTGRIFWIDSLGKKIFSARSDGSKLFAWDVPNFIGSLALREQGGAVLAMQGGFHFLNLESGALGLICDPESELEGNRLNDGKVDCRRRFFAGSLVIEETGKHAALYRLDPDPTVAKILDGIICSNGPAWSPDNKTFYFHDSWMHETWAFDFDCESGTLSKQRVFSRSMEGVEGVPDGSTVDEEGYIWTAKCYGGRVDRYAPDGSLERSIRLVLCPQPTDQDFSTPRSRLVRDERLRAVIRVNPVLRRHRG
jgi:L-arabinonolactonase